MNERLGQCYILSYRYVMTHNNYTLVHGYITSLDKLKTIDHAWVEKNDKVYDPVMDKEYPKIVYYALFSAESDKTYTSKETLRMGVEFETYGPWHEIPKDKIKF
jgi:carbohydrate-selective porin OprB